MISQILDAPMAFLGIAVPVTLITRLCLMVLTDARRAFRNLRQARRPGYRKAVS